jgi:hypothetical protein
LPMFPLLEFPQETKNNIAKKKKPIVQTGSLVDF